MWRVIPKIQMSAALGPLERDVWAWPTAGEPVPAGVTSGWERGPYLIYKSQLKPHHPPQVQARALHQNIPPLFFNLDKQPQLK